MKIIKADSCGQAWLALTRSVLNEGYAFYDEKEQLVEQMNMALMIESPNYLGDDEINLADQKHTQRGLQKFSSLELLPGAYFSYGQRLYDMCGINQVSWVENRLRRKKETKSATFSTLLPGDTNEHLPCLSLVDFKIRSGSLHLISVFRSQNVLTRHPGNSLALAKLLNEMATRLDVSIGSHLMHIISAHIYIKELQEVDQPLRQVLGENLVTKWISEREY